MALIDILVPRYRQLHPFTEDALKKILNFSSCKCFQAGLAALRGGQRLDAKRHAGYFHHPSECPAGKHDVVVSPSISSSVVHWSRNELVKAMRPQAEWALFCDDDIVAPEDALERMLSHGKEIVSALCTRRCDPPEPTIRQWVEEHQKYGVLYEWPNHGKLIEVDAVGTGFLLIHRKVFEDMARAYHPECYERDGNGFWFEFLKTIHGYEWGEDISFSWKAQRIGYRIYCDTAIQPAHMGDYNYTVEDFLDQKDAFLEKHKDSFLHVEV